MARVESAPIGNPNFPQAGRCGLEPHRTSLIGNAVKLFQDQQAAGR